MRNKNINQFAESNGGRKIWRDGEKIKLCWFPIDFHADRGPGHHCSCGFGCATIIIYTGVPICWRRFIHIQDRMLEPASGRCKHASRGRERGKNPSHTDVWSQALRWSCSMVELVNGMFGVEHLGGAASWWSW